jgi:Protein of unknown function (DUF1488)
VHQTAAATHSFTNLIFEPGRTFVADPPNVVNVEGLQSVLFLARRGECTLRCYVTRQALIAYFGAQHDAADAGPDCLLAYDKFAAFIHGLVRHLIAEDMQAPSGAIVITADVVFRHLATGRVSGDVAGAAAAEH